MKRILIILSVILINWIQAQETKQIPQINVVGQGIIKVIPDQAFITATIENKGNNSRDVKSQNDQQMDSVLKFLKKLNLPSNDFRMKRVSLNPIYDYEKKKTTYNASQTLEILLKDLDQYDDLMEGMVNLGLNRIDNVVFQSSKLAEYETEARTLAMKDAKQKADDYVAVLGQKTGKAISISDNSQVYQPQPLYTRMKTMVVGSEGTPRETLAPGEIAITANVNVTFVID